MLTAVQRRIPTRSLSTTADNAVTMRGATKTSAIASVMGIREMAEKKNIVEPRRNPPRTICSAGRRSTSASTPWRHRTTGSSMAR